MRGNSTPHQEDQEALILQEKVEALDTILDLDAIDKGAVYIVVSYCRE